MVFKAVLLLLVLTASQVIATSILQLRSLGSLETLETRQGTGDCTICTTVSNIAGNCTTVGCICNVDLAAMVQDCVNCALAADQSPTTVTSAQNIIDAFAESCSTIPGIPAITRPAGVPSPPSSVRGSSTIPRTATSTSRGPVTVTTASVPPVVQTTVDSVPTTTSTPGVGGGGVPPVVQSGAEKGWQVAGFAVIGAWLGAALLL